jgi:hypothetical protein
VFSLEETEACTIRSLHDSLLLAHVCFASARIRLGSIPATTFPHPWTFEELDFHGSNHRFAH